MPKRKVRLGAGDLILNTPFEEPSKYWSYDRKYMIFTQMDGRRPAGYIVATPDSQGFNDPGQFVELGLVNQIRLRVKAWREANWLGATGITRRLLEHWHDPNQREGMRFFFCQMEAIETLIWLTEAPAAEKQGIDIPSDGGPFPRWCAKMATGGGKTIVMAMVVAWQTLNQVTYGHDARYSKHILVIAPGLTVRNRLAVLVPDSHGNYFDLFQIVPPALYGKLRHAAVVIHNWHKLGWDTDELISRRRRVDKRGAKSDEAYVREVLGNMATARNLIVINDEAHHAWRMPTESTVKGVAKDELEVATKWINGLDRIHRTRRLLHCFDFSATPFAPSRKKSNEDALFGWITSDFGLNDAIESARRASRATCLDHGRESDRNGSSDQVCVRPREDSYSGTLCRRTDVTYRLQCASAGRNTRALENSNLVDSWVKNDHLGFEILYIYRGAVRKYRPDFLVRLNCGTMVIVEVKGQESDQTRAKHRFLDEWVRAISRCETFGEWRWTVLSDPARIEDQLSEFAQKT